MFDGLVINDAVLELIRMAFAEDVGAGDETVRIAIPPELRGSGRIVARRPGVISGTVLLRAILDAYPAGNAMELSIHKRDGESVSAGDSVAVITGAMGTLLTAERVLLNFLSRLCGVATMTRRYVDIVANAVAEAAKRPVICDIRKTTPGWRVLEKYAVRCGGGVNHRMGLYDGVMLKDNHLAALRERLGVERLGELTRRVRGELRKEITLWLEVDTLEQLAEELNGGGADIVLLDNFDAAKMREAMAMRGRRTTPLLEASGGITEATLPEIARTGVDRIAVGALTHSSGILDLSMEVG